MSFFTRPVVRDHCYAMLLCNEAILHDLEVIIHPRITQQILIKKKKLRLLCLAYPLSIIIYKEKKTLYTHTYLLEQVDYYRYVYVAQPAPAQTYRKTSLRYVKCVVLVIKIMIWCCYFFMDHNLWFVLASFHLLR